MLRIPSSAFGDLSIKFSQASKSMAEGEVEPGLKTESVEAVTGEWCSQWHATTIKPLTWNLLDEVWRFLTNDANTVHLSDSYRSTRVEISDRVDHKYLSLQEVMPTYCSVSPKGPTKIAKESHVTRIASLPHHSIWRTGPVAAGTFVVSNSAMLRWKSFETTHSAPLNVNSARDLPFGEGEMWVKGPRESRWSTVSKLSTVWIVVSTESRTSTWRDMFKSGGMTAQDCGGSLKSFSSESETRSQTTHITYLDWRGLRGDSLSNLWLLEELANLSWLPFHSHEFSHQLHPIPKRQVQVSIADTLPADHINGRCLLHSERRVVHQRSTQSRWFCFDPTKQGQKGMTRIH